LSDAPIQPVTSDSRGLGTDALPTHTTTNQSSDKSKSSGDTTIITKETDVKPNLTGISEKLNEKDSKKTDLHNMDTKENKKSNTDYKNLSLFSDKKLKLEVSLQNARQSLFELFSPFSDKKAIPSQLFKEAKGIVFLSVIKGAVGIGGALGTGVVMARNNDLWSSPCAISLTGVQIGFDIGIERVDHILLLRDEHALKIFEKEAWNIGTDVSIAAGPLGGDINLGVFLNDTKEMISVYAYSMAKGAYIGVSLNGGLIKIRHDWNKEFYGREMGLNEMFEKSMPPTNKEYTSLVAALNECCRT
jgi:lipid-binding SYLF domain-containing protein